MFWRIFHTALKSQNILDFLRITFAINQSQIQQAALKLNFESKRKVYVYKKC